MKTGIVRTLAHAARIAALPLAAVAIPAIAHAQSGQRELFEWRGAVDQEVRIQMRGGQTAVMGMGPREVTGYNQVRALSGVPSANGYVSVQMMQGRGRADVVQQPTAQNGYTTIVRVRDTQGGAGSYAIAAFWQPNGNYGYGNSGYGNSGYGNSGYGNSGYGNSGQYGTYGKTLPGGNVQQQPVYRNGYPVNQGGKQLPGAQQANVPVYGTYPYPAGQRVTPNGKVLPGPAQKAHAKKNGHDRKHRDSDREHD